ncbi:MAG: hypothetical protein P8129_03910 [Anaerolineae bacterium]
MLVTVAGALVIGMLLVLALAGGGGERTPTPVSTSAIVVVVSQTPGATAATTPTGSPSTPVEPGSTSTPTASPSPAPTIVVETATGTELTADTTLGEASVEYPLYMNPGASDFVNLSVYVPPMLASVKPMSVERVQIPEDAPAVQGEVNRYRATIMLARTMRAELHALGFEVEELYPRQQAVDIEQINQPTIWAWNIKAPETAASHNLVLQVYLGNDPQPSWVRSFTVDVSGTPEPPAVPPLVLGIVIAVLVLGNGLLGLVLFRLLRRKRRSVFQRRHGYDLASLRELLRTAFGPRELYRLCQDTPQLRPILDDLDADPSLNEIVDAIIAYCERYALFETLLTEVQARNAAQYTRFESRLRRVEPKTQRGST